MLRFALATLLAGGLLAMPPPAVAQDATLINPGKASGVLTAAEAHAKATKGELVLVDIRHPEEWKQTGVPESGHAITMHQKGPEFLKQLEAATGGDKSKPVALICATGSRTTYLQAPLQQQGYTTVLNVTEGMMGNRIGKGWLKAGLPVRRWQPGSSAPAAVARQ
ncbi:MAG: rhodanese-like domain-containing protein [Pseudomonadota bacterium]